MKWIPRFIFICKIFFKYHLIDFFVQRKKQYLIKFLFKKNEIQNKSLPIRLRMALEDLGPIFIKFGQILSTRPDLLSIEYIKELSKLQDNVPPFNNQIAKDIIQKSLNKSINEIFKDFDLNPIASASIAQVYKAKLHNGDIVAVKVLRPNLQKIIEQDLALINFIAYWGERFSNDGKRLKLREVVAEFDKYLHDELDLMREAANASQLRRNFLNSEMLIIPKVYFDYCSSNVLVIEWMNGIPISNIETLREKNIDLSKLSRYGVEIFFTQVFKFGFFHADMHPGNILVSIDGRYIALDFGIVGSLTNHDKRYLAINLLAFLNRDYHRVATAHIESNWVPANTNAEELEAAIRAVCEPFFNQPLSKISFGFVLMRLFETSRRFNVEIQPQLVLLQKTLLNVEGLGRQLDPNLNLWDTAKPFLTKWMNEQIGPKAFLKNIKKESIDWADIFPTLPRKINTLLDDKKQIEIQKMQFYLLKSQQRQNLYLIIILIILLILLFLK